MAITFKGKNNKLSSSDAFKEKAKYDKLFLMFGRGMIDLWKPGNHLYGKVDTMGNYIMPIEEYMSPVRTGPLKKKTVFALSFVKEMYEDFSNFFQERVVSGIIPRSRNIIVEPAKGWTSLRVPFHNVQQKTFDRYFTAVRLDNKEAVKVKDFDSFIKSYTRHLGENNITPFTKTGHFTGNSSVLNTGLAIEISDDPYDDDRIKYQKFITDPSFKDYVLAANKYGFYVDKNIPWRLIVNLDSPYTKEYLQTFYSINNKKKLFETFFVNSVNQDIDSIKYYYTAFYNKIQKEIPSYSLLEKRENGTTCTRRVKRPHIFPEDEMISESRNSIWVRVILYLRAKEAKKSWDQNKFEKVYEECVSQLQRFGLNKALEHASMYFGNKMQASASYVLTKDNSHSIIKTSRTPGSFRF